MNMNSPKSQNSSVFMWIIFKNVNTALNTSLRRPGSRSDAELHRVISMVVRLCTNGAWAIGSNRLPQGIAIVEGFINYLSGTWQTRNLREVIQ